jgi:hypothetical protein
MSDTQSGPQFESVPLITGAVLLGAGALIGAVGLAVGGGHLIAATRRWIKEMEVPPSELARQKWSQARTAVEAGASAWQNGSQGAPASGGR